MVSGMQITPTAIASGGAWEGTYSEGNQFSDQQLFRMQGKYRNRIKWDVRTVTVKRQRQRTGTEIAMGKPVEEAVDRVEVACPIISRGIEHDWVIAPGGDEVRVKSTANGRRKK